MGCGCGNKKQIGGQNLNLVNGQVPRERQVGLGSMTKRSTGGSVNALKVGKPRK